MSISASPLASEPTTPFHALAPLRVPPDLRLTPEQFALLRDENREAVLELAAAGSLIVMAPTGNETGARNSRLEMRLLLWADQQGGWKVLGSSTGFRLPDASVLSPGASRSLAGPHPEQRRSFTQSGGRNCEPQRRRSSRPYGPALQDGRIPCRRCSARLVAHPSPTSCVSVARKRSFSAIRRARGVGGGPCFPVPAFAS